MYILNNNVDQILAKTLGQSNPHSTTTEPPTQMDIESSPTQIDIGTHFIELNSKTITSNKEMYNKTKAAE